MDTNIAVPKVTFGHAGASVTIAEATIRALWLASAGMVPQPFSPDRLQRPTRIGEKDGDGNTCMGVVRNDDGIEYRIWDLGEAPERLNHEPALAWAKERGGDLPTRREQSLMFANRGEGQFKSEWYWSKETHAGGESYAWVQGFGGGDQNGGHKGSAFRARAVRREAIQ